MIPTESKLIHCFLGSSTHQSSRTSPLKPTIKYSKGIRLSSAAIRNILAACAAENRRYSTRIHDRHIYLAEPMLISGLLYIQEAMTNQVILNDDDPQAIEAMIHFMYSFDYEHTGRTMLPTVFHAKVYQVADKYLV